jgi:hypothetical protein
MDKFGLPSEILESPAFRRRGLINAFDQPGKVIICSYQLASNRAIELPRQSLRAPSSSTKPTA